MFNTSEGQKTGTELARELAEWPNARLDIRSRDGSLEAKVRGGKSVVEGQAEKIQRAVEIQQGERHGTGSGGGGLASKVNGSMDLGDLGASSLPPEIADIAPMIREIGEAGVTEALRGWLSAPPKSRVRGGREHRVLKGVSHLSALKAMQAFDDVRDGEQTLTRHGERVDFLVGKNPMARLSPVKTLSRALACGGIMDDRCEVREVRITTDAPNLTFVMDASGSMAQGDRLLCAVAAAQALAEYYGPKGGTFGYVELTGGDPILRVPPGEPCADRVVDAILDVEPNWGTAYAPSIELAIRASQPKTTVLIFGDFEDSGVLSQEALALKSEKEIRVVGITDPTGNYLYAASLCDEVHMVDMNDPTQVALVALKAAES